MAVQQPFNPNEHLTQLKGKEYLEVKFRLVWFRDRFPHGQIRTEMLHLDLEKNMAVFKAVVEDGEGGVAVGHGSESSRDFGDYIEKAETKAIGRALAALGYGTQFAPEMEEGERVVDSPVARNNDSTTRQQNRSTSNQHASQSRQDANLSDLEIGNKSARQNSVAASGDSGASEQGHSSAKDATARIQAIARLAIQKGELTPGSKTADLLKKCSEILKVTITSPVHLTPSRMDSVEKYLRSIGQPVEGEAQAVEA